MSLKSIVKVSHLSNLSDARYCAGMGVDMLGFGVIPGGVHFMPAKIFQDIRGWISGPRIIAELYGLSSEQEVTDIVNAYSPDFLELTLREYRAFGDSFTLPCLLYVSREELGSIPADDRIARIIVDEDTSCKDISAIRTPVLSHISSLQTLNDKASEGCFQGYVLPGPEEIRPGVTNYDQLGVILEALEECDE